MTEMWYKAIRAIYLVCVACGYIRSRRHWLNTVFLPFSCPIIPTVEELFFQRLPVFKRLPFVYENLKLVTVDEWENREGEGNALAAYELHQPYPNSGLPTHNLCCGHCCQLRTTVKIGVCQFSAKNLICFSGCQLGLPSLYKWPNFHQSKWRM